MDYHIIDTTPPYGVYDTVAITADTFAEAAQQARAIARKRHQEQADEIGQTVRVHMIIQDRTFEERKIAEPVHPNPPPCTAKRHSWEHVLSPSFGEGVLHIHRCTQCGIYRARNTWATDPQDGTPGHVAISYWKAGKPYTET